MMSYLAHPHPLLNQLFECLTGASLIQVERTPTVDPVSVHLGRIAEHIGPFPANFLDKCTKRAEYFDEAGKALRRTVVIHAAHECRVGVLLRVPPPLPAAGSLESWFGGFLQIRETMSEADVKATCAFMRRCLTIDPSARATAAQLLQDEWLRT